MAKYNTNSEQFERRYNTLQRLLNGEIQNRKDPAKVAGYFIISKYPVSFIENVGETSVSLAKKLFILGGMYQGDLGKRSIGRFRMLQEAYDEGLAKDAMLDKSIENR